MELALWTYEGPPHIGAMRIAASMTGTHLVLHAPQGDTYADLLFTMIQRDKARPPVTYTTFQARDLGSDTAEIFLGSVRDTLSRVNPELLLVGASCTAELIQDDPGGLSKTVGADCPVIALDLPAYSKKENWGAGETFYQIVRQLNAGTERPAHAESVPPSCNILGPTSLGFRNRDDVIEVKKLLEGMGIAVNCVAPLGASPADIGRLHEADFNIVLYPEIAGPAADWLKKTFDQPYTALAPIGTQATQDFVRAVAELAGITPPAPSMIENQFAWYSRSVDSTYLTGKRVFIFADAVHARAAARVCHEELGFEVVGLGTYERTFAREVRADAKALGLEALITDNYLDVAHAIEEAAPELVLGTQMERHTSKKLGIGCAVISCPAHVQDYPARFSPQMGPEGANVLFDSWVHPLMMGLEEHLLQMFSEDFEFGQEGAPSHLASHSPGALSGTANPEGDQQVEPGARPQTSDAEAIEIIWAEDAEAELKKIPFFVRGKARRNTEKFAKDQGIHLVSTETLYEAKAHYARH